MIFLELLTFIATEQTTRDQKEKSRDIGILKQRESFKKFPAVVMWWGGGGWSTIFYQSGIVMLFRYTISPKMNRGVYESTAKHIIC